MNRRSFLSRVSTGLAGAAVALKLKPAAIAEPKTAIAEDLHVKRVAEVGGKVGEIITVRKPQRFVMVDRPTGIRILAPDGEAWQRNYQNAQREYNRVASLHAEQIGEAKFLGRVRG